MTFYCHLINKIDFDKGGDPMEIFKIDLKVP